MPRGIRDVRHKQIIFGDLQYFPSQVPYQPKGFRKMENVWYDWENGIPYITMVPGYTSLGTVPNSADCKALAHVHGNNRGTYFYTNDDLMYEVEGDGTFTSIDLSGVAWSDTFTNAGRMQALGYGNHTYIFSGSTTASANNITFKTSNPAGLNEYGNAGPESIGFTRPDVSGSSSAQGTAGGAVKGVVRYFVSYTGQNGNDEGPISAEFGEVDAEDGYDIDLTALPTKEQTSAGFTEPSVTVPSRSTLPP